MNRLLVALVAVSVAGAALLLVPPATLALMSLP